MPDLENVLRVNLFLDSSQPVVVGAPEGLFVVGFEYIGLRRNQAMVNLGVHVPKSADLTSFWYAPPLGVTSRRG